MVVLLIDLGNANLTLQTIVIVLIEVYIGSNEDVMDSFGHLSHNFNALVSQKQTRNGKSSFFCDRCVCRLAGNNNLSSNVHPFSSK